MNEKIYHQDEHVKITDLRITANHITVPIDKIDKVLVDFKVATMTVAITIFLLSLILIPAVCCFYGCCGWCGLLVVFATAIWLRMIYKSYTELKISTGGKIYKILDASMRRREYVFKIEDALKIAVEKKSGKENQLCPEQ